MQNVISTEAIAAALELVAKMLFLAFMIEASVEFFIARPLKSNPKIPASLILPYVSLTLGLVTAFATKLNVGEVVGLDVHPTFSYILTGLIIGRGGNFVSDISDRFLKHKE